jgi:hypothetical protein
MGRFKINKNMAMKQITVIIIATIQTTGASLISQTLEIYATEHTIMKCFNSPKNARNIVLKKAPEMLCQQNRAPNREKACFNR